MLVVQAMFWSPGLSTLEQGVHLEKRR
jgi:hypothetical protein